MEKDSSKKQMTIGERTRVTEWVKHNVRIEQVRDALIKEFSAVAPRLDLPTLTTAQNGRTPILEITIVRSVDGSLVTVMQNLKDKPSPGKVFLLVLALLMLGASLGPWVLVIAVPAAIFWMFKQEKNAPFSSEQIAMCLRNMKTQIEHQGEGGVADSQHTTGAQRAPDEAGVNGQVKQPEVIEPPPPLPDAADCSRRLAALGYEVKSSFGKMWMVRAPNETSFHMALSVADLRTILADVEAGKAMEDRVRS